MISRWITPVIYQPRISPLNGAEWGFGNLLPQWENQGGPGTDGQKILVFGDGSHLWESFLIL